MICNKKKRCFVKDQHPLCVRLSSVSALRWLEFGFQWMCVFLLLPCWGGGSPTPPSYCVWQAQNQSTCQQEKHAKLLLPSLRELRLPSHSAAQTISSSKSWSIGSAAGYLPEMLQWFFRVITRFTSIVSSMTDMRFLQDLISNRRRRRDWTNPWSLVSSGIQPSVTPVMV